MQLLFPLVLLAIAALLTLGQALDGQRLDMNCPSGTTVAGFPNGECQCDSVEKIKGAGGQICKDSAVANSFASCETKSPGPAQCWFTCNPGFQWSDATKTACIPLPALDFSGTNWIWTSGMAAGTVPNGNRVAARKVFIAPEGKVPVHAQILTAADDTHTVYVNGRAVISTTSWGVPKSACSSLNPCLNVFSVHAANIGGIAGLIAKIRVTYLDGSTSTLVTDASWRVDGSVPAGFETLAFDDSAWATAYVITPYGQSLWTRFGTLPPSAQCQPASSPPCACKGECPRPDGETGASFAGIFVFPLYNLIFRQVKSELECSAEADTMEYLSAVPGEGCVCKSTSGPYFCGSPVGDDDAVQMCSDKISNGNRETKCYPLCSEGFTAKDKNVCEKKPGGTSSGCIPADCEAEEKEKQAREEERQEREEAREAREEERVEREEARKAREEEREFREEQAAANAKCGCSSDKPSIPSISDAPKVADKQMQALIGETIAKLGLKPCPAGLAYVKSATGYQCTGGGHRITFAQLGMK
ncbi:hypothetical protein B0H16DRAFT_262914 [Mycena metata]|uniref:Uncharacterized protein n=1 Tax=Mycena metata TaxID=1033252 RepID=A0AAD7HRL5_9AGAR|nr:hypothetical protein B0H16DRAFT_262914 [Mycena metata]